ncbi:MAG: DUF2442 domain-containing protein [Roseitalea sp.]|nr:DUF2442 domain-containing protein [Roseitalea sp.]MBO6722745.1 DUF2442 domain-containing protein [Roseitalea sp.]MBO6745181.1 DUF2442 domain-containing protein [Roseitalea sp.]
MIELVKILSIDPVGDYRLQVCFSNGREGICDLSDMVGQDGPMLKPLADPEFFARAFVQTGTIAWPNGFDVDAIALHDEMLKAGQLEPALGGA